MHRDTIARGSAAPDTIRNTVIAVAMGFAVLVGCANAAAEAPVPASPADGATVTAGQALELRATYPLPAAYPTFVVSRTSYVNPDGTLGQPLASSGAGASQPTLEVSPGLYSFDAADLVKQPGALYWQVSAVTCKVGDWTTGFATTCTTEPSPVRSLNVLPAPVKLTVSANRVQRVTTDRLSLHAACTVACTVELSVAARVIVHGKAHAEPQLGYQREAKLGPNTTTSLSHQFVGAARSALGKLVERHGSVLFRVNAVAIDAYAHTSTVTRLVEMHPKLKVHRRPPASPAQRLRAAARKAAQAELTKVAGDSAYVDSCERLDTNEWRCGYSVYGAYGSTTHGYVYVTHNRYGWHATVI